MKRRIVALDILKLVCAVLIVLHHYQQELHVRFATINFFGGTFYFGYLVELFFIISGFVSCLSKKPENDSFGIYLLKIVKRIYPICILSVVMMLGLNALCYLQNGFVLKSDGMGIWNILCSIFILFSNNVIPFDGTGINNPLWYIEVLIMCYVIDYFINWVCKRIKLNRTYLYIFVIITGLSAYERGWNLPFLYVSTSRGYITYFSGKLLYGLFMKINNTLLCAVSALALFGCVGLGVLDYMSFYDRFYEILVFIIYPAILMMVLYFDRYIPQNNLTDKILKNLSFEIYVWHSFFISLLRYIIVILPNLSVYMSQMEVMIMFAIMVIVFSFFIGMFVQEPLNKFVDNVLIRYLQEKLIRPNGGEIND